MSDPKDFNVPPPSTATNTLPADDQAPVAPSAARSIEAAHRHARFVRLMRLLLPLTGLFLIGLFVYLSGIFSPLPKPSINLERVTLSKDRLQMDKPVIKGFSKASGAYKLTAGSAYRKVIEPDKVFLNKVDADINSKDGGWSKVNAKKGVFDKKSNILKLEGNVRMKSDKGYVAVMDKATIAVKKGNLKTRSPVVVTLPSGTIRATGMEIFNKGERFVFHKRARMQLRMGRSKKK